MKLTFIDELKNCIGESVGFSVGIYSGGANVTNVKGLIEYSFSCIAVCTKDGKTVVLQGENLFVTKIIEGDLTCKGKITSVAVK